MSLTAPVLSAVDNAALPTGVVATITNSDVASTNTLSYQKVDAGFTATAWTAGGSRTGNGTISQALAAGLYWLRVDSVLSNQSAVSNLAYLAVTDGTLAVHEQCIQSVEAGLRALVAAGRIPGITLSARITDHAELDLSQLDLPGIAVAVCLPGQQPSESQEGGTNARDDLGLPCFVVLLDRADGAYVAGRPGYLKARESIFRYFRAQRLAGLASNVACKIVRVEPGPILKYENSTYQVMGSVLTIRPVIRDVRG